MAKKAKAVKAADGKPVNPLMLDGKSWNRAKVTEIVCKRISSSNRSIITILAEVYDGFELPDYTTFNAWLAEDDKISHEYACAKADQADFLAEEMLEIADNGTNDTYKDDNGNVRTDQDVIARSRLRIDTRKWLASKLKPKKYGDRTTIAGDSENPLAVLTMEQITLSPKSRLKVK